VCAELDLVLTGNVQQSSPGLSQILQCAQNGSLGFQSLIQVGRNGIQQAVDSGCNGTTCLCFPDQCFPAPPGGYPPSGCPPTCNQSNLNQFAEVLIHNPPYDSTAPLLTVRQCNISCTRAQDRANAGSVVNALDSIVLYIGIIDNEIIPLLNCDFVITLINSIKQSVCVELHKGTQGVKRISMALCFFLCLGVIALTLGQKRFIGLDDPDTRVEMLKNGHLEGYDGPLELDHSSMYDNDGKEKEAEMKAAP